MRIYPFANMLRYPNFSGILVGYVAKESNLDGYIHFHIIKIEKFIIGSPPFVETNPHIIIARYVSGGTWFGANRAKIGQEVERDTVIPHISQVSGHSTAIIVADASTEDIMNSFKQLVPGINQVWYVE